MNASPASSVGRAWDSNPVEKAPEAVQMVIIDLQTSDLCKSVFHDLDILDFYKTLPVEVLHLKNRICATVLVSVSSHWCI